MTERQEDLLDEGRINGWKATARRLRVVATGSAEINNQLRLAEATPEKKVDFEHQAAHSLALVLPGITSFIWHLAAEAAGNRKLTHSVR